MMIMLGMLTTMMDRSDEPALLHRDPHLHHQHRRHPHVLHHHDDQMSEQGDFLVSDHPTPLSTPETPRGSLLNVHKSSSQVMMVMMTMMTMMLMMVMMVMMVMMAMMPSQCA